MSAKGITVFCQLLHGARLSPGHSTAASGGAADVGMLSMRGEKEKKIPPKIPKIGHAEQGWGQAALVSGVGGY